MASIDEIAKGLVKVAKKTKEAASAVEDLPKAGTKVTAKRKAAPAPKNMAQVPSLRGMPVEDAVALARKELHLIPSGERGAGGYLGGPRDIQTRRQLGRMRSNLDAYIAQDPRGADWYDRYRQGVMDVTDGDPRSTQWFTNREGMYSAGVSPEGELGFALKDLNSAIAGGGIPVKAARPAQQAASIRAYEANDPRLFQLGKKTGEYARLVDPNRGGVVVPGATGVNDFRHLRNLGYTEASGEAQRNAVGAAGHTFADYETALAVDRANKRAVGGFTDWTGEKLQAAPWVLQKGQDFHARYKKSYDGKASKMLPPLAKGADPEAVAARNAEVDRLSFELAMQDANRTIADYFPKHTAYGTYEAQPFAAGGHLPGSASATPAERLEFANDPRSAWDFAMGGRDAIYAGMRVPGTDAGMAVRRTEPMSGVYEGPMGMETNPGFVARPLVAFDAGKVKSMPEADMAIMQAGEGARGLLDYQGAGAFNKTWVGGQAGQSNSVVGVKSASGALTTEQLQKLQEIGRKYGLPDVNDRGDSVLFTDFYNGAPSMNSKTYKAFSKEINDVMNFKTTDRAKVDSGYIGYEDAWQAGQGSGAATNQFLSMIDSMPEGIARSLGDNEMVKKAAADRLSRDAEWASRWGATREDVQNLRSIIANSKGNWITALKEAVKAGAVLPVVAVGFLSDFDEGQQ